MAESRDSLNAWVGRLERDRAATCALAIASATASAAIAASASLPHFFPWAAFKSYRQRTLVGAPFGQFTAVVGPNGTGKSVVVSWERVRETF